MSEQTQQQLDQIEALFVQSAHGLTSSAGTVTFHGLSHSTLFFSDRPQRVVGHLHSRKFVDQWGEGENSFAEDPPNAVISFLEDGDMTPEEVTVTISDPQLDGNTLTYKIAILTGRFRPRRDRVRSSLIRSAGRCRRSRSPGYAAASVAVTAASSGEKSQESGDRPIDA